LLALPDNAHGHTVGGAATYDDLVDQAAQKGLLLLSREHALMPNSGQALPQCGKGCTKLGRNLVDAVRCRRRRLQIGLGLLKFAEVFSQRRSSSAATRRLSGSTCRNWRSAKETW